jgi:hypothetical protein
MVVSGGFPIGRADHTLAHAQMRTTNPMKEHLTSPTPDVPRVPFIEVKPIGMVGHPRLKLRIICASQECFDHGASVPSVLFSTM